METYRLMDYSSFKGVKVSESRKITHWAIFGKSVERLNPLELYPWKTAWHIFLAFSLLLLIILSDLLVWWCTFCSKLIFSNCSVNLYLEQWQRDSISYKAADVFISAHHTRICCWSSWLPNPDVPWNSFFLFHNHNLGVEYNSIWAEQLHPDGEPQHCCSKSPGFLSLPVKSALTAPQDPDYGCISQQKQADLGLICVMKERARKS